MDESIKAESDTKIEDGDKAASFSADFFKAGGASNFAIFQEMMKAGLMYGHKKTKTNPKFRQYIFGNRNGVEIIDLSRTLSMLDSAIEFLRNKIKEGGSVLLVAIQPAAREAAEKLAKKFKFSFINERWIGGLLTNFNNISKRIEYFKKTQSDLEKGAFDKYTKKERVMINKNVERMKRMFTGLENFSKLPDVIFVVDASIKGHATAIHEAKKLNIPIVAVIDSDDNPEAADYLIPANDHAKTSVDWLMKKIEEGLEK